DSPLPNPSAMKCESRARMNAESGRTVPRSGEVIMPAACPVQRTAPVVDETQRITGVDPADPAQGEPERPGKRLDGAPVLWRRGEQQLVIVTAGKGQAHSFGLLLAVER